MDIFALFQVDIYERVLNNTSVVNMKETVLKVLAYLFENHIHGKKQIQTDNADLYNELTHLGFPLHTINKALSWIDALQEIQKDAKDFEMVGHRSTRIFTPQEQVRIEFESQNLLLHLKNIGILNPITFELVIDKLLELEHYFIDTHDVQLVILMILSNHPAQKAELARMEDLVLNDQRGTIH